VAGPCRLRPGRRHGHATKPPLTATRADGWRRRPIRTIGHPWFGRSPATRLSSPQYLCDATVACHTINMSNISSSSRPHPMECPRIRSNDRGLPRCPSLIDTNGHTFSRCCHKVSISLCDIDTICLRTCFRAEIVSGTRQLAPPMCDSLSGHCDP